MLGLMLRVMFLLFRMSEVGMLIFYGKVWVGCYFLLGRDVLGEVCVKDEMDVLYDFVKV